MSEPKEIEPYYRRQGKQLVDCLFDKGLLSESLSRDGMDAIEELLAFYLQSASDTAARTASLVKRYKEPGHERHEEEMRWIARAKAAEGALAERDRMDADLAKMRPNPESLAAWALDVCAFLKKAAADPLFWEVSPISTQLFTDAIVLGIIPEPL